MYGGLKGKLGVLQLSLCYQPVDESITVVIMKARDLKAKDINGLSGQNHQQMSTNIDVVCWIPNRNTVSYLESDAMTQ